MSTLCIIQARMSSTRLPGKVLKEINGKPMLFYCLERLKESKTLDKVVVATSDHKDDDVIADFCQKEKVDCFRGSLEDVLSRYAECAKKYPEYDTIVRVTSDCPLIDPKVVDKVVSNFLKEKMDYVSNVLEETFPDGIDIEAFSRKALLASDKEALLHSEREHVTLYIRNNPKFKKLNIKNKVNMSKYRLTVDNPEDFEVISFLIENYGYKLTFEEYCKHLDKHPEIMEKNSKIERNAGLKKSLKEDKNSSNS
ncbi:MAG: glycosyltransferase family protein [Patescibacteria group bacterium]